MAELNVIWIIPNLDRRLAELAREMRDHGIRIEIVALQRSPYLLAGPEGPAAILEPHLAGARDLRRNAEQLEALLSGTRVDLVHAVGLPAARIAIRAARRHEGTRIIAEYNGDTVSRWHKTARAGFCHPDISRVLVREAHHLRYLKSRAAAPRSKIRLIPAGINPDWYQDADFQCRARTRQDEMFVVGLSLEGISLNNLKLVLAAYSWLPPDANIKLLLIDRTDRCEEISRELHQWSPRTVAGTHIIKDRSDPSIFWSACAASLHFLDSHSQTDPLRDSMASSVAPIIVSSSKIKIVDDLNTGLQVTSANPHSLGQAILCLRNDLDACRSMALNARDAVLPRSRLQKSVAALATMYRLTATNRKQAVPIGDSHFRPRRDQWHHVSC